MRRPTWLTWENALWVVGYLLAVVGIIYLLVLAMEWRVI